MTEFALLTAGKAALLLVFSLAACRAASRAPAALRHTICLAALVASAGLPILQMTLPAIDLGLLTAARSPAAARVGPDGLSIALLGAWLTGTIFVWFRIGVGLHSTVRAVRRSVPVRDAGILDAALEARRALGSRLPLHLGFLDDVPGPVSFGLPGRHAILLPPAARGWPRSRLKTVFLHEIAHLARRDCLTQAIAAFACALYWFLPPAWWALRRMRIEREIACDDRALLSGTRPSAYASFLVNSFRLLRGGDPMPAAAASVGGREELERRVGEVLSTRRCGGALRGTRVGIALAAIALVLPLAAVKASPAPSPARRTESRIHVFAFAAASSGTFLAPKISVEPAPR